MGNEKNRVDWARIIADPEREASGGMNSPGEWKLLAVLKHCLPRNFRRIFRKELIKIMCLLIFFIGCSALGASIAVLQAWWTHGMRTAEIKKTETRARYSSSDGTETLKSKSRERYASSEKRTKRDFKLCVINGERYMMYSDGTIWEDFNGGWLKLDYPPGWLVAAIKSTPHNGFWSPL